MRRKRILITGGAGFIGSHLIERLLTTQRYTVLTIDDFNNFYNPKEKHDNLIHVLKNPHFILKKGDIVNENFVKKTVASFKPTYVVHLAARAGVRPSLEDPVLYTKVNVIGTINIWESVKNLNIKNFIFGSSSSVYGENKKTPFSESDTIENQISPYAVTKKSGELISKMYSEDYKIPTTCLRFFTVYGPRQRPDLAIRKFMQNILKGKKIQMFGKGNSSRDYTYVDDVVSGIEKSINTPYKFEIINLGNAHPITLKKMIAKIEKVVNRKAHIEEVPFQQGDVTRTYADISKAHKLLKWKPTTSFDEGLAKMAEWFINYSKK